MALAAGRLLFPLVVSFAHDFRSPALLFNQITFPLQIFGLPGSRRPCSPFFLGVPVLREGNVILISRPWPLEVADACSGIRSLMSLVTPPP